MLRVFAACMLLSFAVYLSSARKSIVPSPHLSCGTRLLGTIVQAHYPVGLAERARALMRVFHSSFAWDSSGYLDALVGNCLQQQQQLLLLLLLLLQHEQSITDSLSPTHRHATD